MSLVVFYELGWKMKWIEIIWFVEEKVFGFVLVLEWICCEVDEVIDVGYSFVLFSD